MKVGEITLAKTASVIKPEQVRTSEFKTATDDIGIEEALKKTQTNTVIQNHLPFNPLYLHRLFSVSAGVDPDLDRYNDILRGKAREELKKFKKPGEMTGIKGGKIINIPVPIIEIPRFTRGEAEGQGGVGSGDGEEGTVIGPPQPGNGTGEAGEEPGEHIKEAWVPMSRSDIAKIFIEDYNLPYLKPKGYGSIKEKSIKWNTFSRVGRELDLNKTIMNALSRTASEIGDKFNIDSEDDLQKFLDTVVIEEEDKIYNSWQIVEKPQVNAVIIYMMDVSGSMTDEQKETVRTISWYLSTIIQYQFGKVRAELRGEKFTDEQFGEGVDEVFIIHDAAAREVNEETFYTTRESGGTKISSAYSLAEQIIKQRYNPVLWNIYLFHFSDGDNWSEDNSKSLSILKNLLSQVNEFGYIQTDSPYGSGDFKSVLENVFSNGPSHLRISRIKEGVQSEYKKAVIDMLGEKNDSGRAA